MRDINWWKYENLQSTGNVWWQANQGDSIYDKIDFHIDLGAGRVPKGRIAIDKRYTRDVTDLCIDLETLTPQNEITEDHYIQMNINGYYGYLPFPDNSIKSVISHHVIEHINNLEKVMEEVYRILEPGGIFRIIVPLFPSYPAVSEYDHCNLFCKGTFNGFCASDDVSMTDGFSEPYNTCKFSMLEELIIVHDPEAAMFSQQDVKELRVALQK